jgi:hypothetical protein
MRADPETDTAPIVSDDPALQTDIDARRCHTPGPAPDDDDEDEEEDNDRGSSGGNIDPDEDEGYDEDDEDEDETLWTLAPTTGDR